MSTTSSASNITPNAELLSRIFALETTLNPFISDRQRRASVAMIIRVRPRYDPLALTLLSHNYHLVYPEYYNHSGNSTNKTDKSILDLDTSVSSLPQDPQLPNIMFLQEDVSRGLEVVKWMTQEWVLNGELEALYIKRSHNPKDRWSGQLAFPGGRQAKGETDLETSIRETREEIGLDLSNPRQFRCIARLDDRHIETFKNVQPLAVSTFVFLQLTPITPCLYLEPKEVSQALWVPLRFFSFGVPKADRRPSSFLSWIQSRKITDGREKILIRPLIVQHIDNRPVYIELVTSDECQTEHYEWRHCLPPVDMRKDLPKTILPPAQSSASTLFPHASVQHQYHHHGHGEDQAPNDQQAKGHYFDTGNPTDYLKPQNPSSLSSSSTSSSSIKAAQYACADSYQLLTNHHLTAPKLNALVNLMGELPVLPWKEFDYSKFTSRSRYTSIPYVKSIPTSKAGRESGNKSDISRIHPESKQQSSSTMPAILPAHPDAPVLPMMTTKPQQQKTIAAEHSSLTDVPALSPSSIPQGDAASLEPTEGDIGDVEPAGDIQHLIDPAPESEHHQREGSQVAVDDDTSSSPTTKPVEGCPLPAEQASLSLQPTVLAPPQNSSPTIPLAIFFPCLFLMGVGVCVVPVQHPLPDDPVRRKHHLAKHQIPFCTRGTSETMLWGMTLRNTASFFAALDHPMMQNVCEYDHGYRRWKLRLYYRYEEIKQKILYYIGMGPPPPPPYKPKPPQPPQQQEQQQQQQPVSSASPTDSTFIQAKL